MKSKRDPRFCLEQRLRPATVARVHHDMTDAGWHVSVAKRLLFFMLGDVKTTVGTLAIAAGLTEPHHVLPDFKTKTVKIVWISATEAGSLVCTSTGTQRELVQMFPLNS